MKGFFLLFPNLVWEQEVLYISINMNSNYCRNLGRVLYL